MQIEGGVRSTKFFFLLCVSELGGWEWVEKEEGVSFGASVKENEDSAGVPNDSTNLYLDIL